MHIIRSADCRSMPWKNGGGTTTEIAVSPEGAGLGEFDWRVSMAQVASSGPFSLFPGVDRTLAILEGAGIGLELVDAEPVRLTAESEPFAFPADVRAAAGLIAGTVVDLNVMTRRGRFVHGVERMTVSSPADIACDAGWTLVFCASGSVSIAVGADEFALGSRDTLLSGPEPARLRLGPRQQSGVFVIRIGVAEASH